MKVLITGGAGFIGSHIQDRLLEEGHEVAVLDNFRSGKKENVNPKAKLFEVDILDKEKLKEALISFSPEAIFHLAAQNEVPYSMEHPFEDQQMNIVGTMNLMEAAKEAGVKKIIYSNTGGALYGQVDDSKLPIVEDEPIYNPTSFYGTSKGAAEMYIRLYGSLYNISWVSLRYANVYGPRQDGNKEAGIVAIFTQRMLKGEQPTINGDGKHLRDYVFVGDVVEANVKALSFDKNDYGLNGHRSNGDYFNVCTGVETSNIEVFETLNKQLASSMTIQFGPERPGDARRVVLSPKKAKDVLGFEAKVNFEEGVKRTIEFYKK